MIDVRPGVILNDFMRRFVETLERQVAGRVPIIVTSGVRDPAEQASAMLKKLAAGGQAELYKVYADDRAIDQLLALPQTIQSWSARIAELAAEGRALSRHLSGRAIDLHTRTLTADQVAVLVQAVQALGGRTLLEHAPPHLHVDLPASMPGGPTSADGPPYSVPPTSGGSGLVAAALGLGVLLLGAWWAWAFLTPVFGPVVSEVASIGALIVRRVA